MDKAAGIYPKSKVEEIFYPKNKQVFQNSSI